MGITIFFGIFGEARLPWIHCLRHGYFKGNLSSSYRFLALRGLIRR